MQNLSVVRMQVVLEERAGTRLVKYISIILSYDPKFVRLLHKAARVYLLSGKVTEEGLSQSIHSEAN